MKPSKSAKRASARRKRRPRGKGLKHVLKTGLPPGIDEGAFWDPGSRAKKRARG